MNLFKRSKKILIVEDEPDIAESIQARLELEHYETILAGDGRVGVEKARAEQPDLVILDVMLPVMNGFETCKVLRKEEKTRRIPILILTALPNIGDVDQAFAAGADDFLNKPYTDDRLLQKVAALLNKKSAQ